MNVGFRVKRLKTKFYWVKERNTVGEEKGDWLYLIYTDKTIEDFKASLRSLKYTEEQIASRIVKEFYV